MMISAECDSLQADGCSMCSLPLKCAHECHKVPKNTKGYHRCDECSEMPQSGECMYTDIKKCPWGENMICPSCGEGTIRHYKE